MSEPVSGDSLNLAKMVEQFGPPSHIAVNPEFIRSIATKPYLSRKPLSENFTYRGYPIVTSSHVKDWWPVWSSASNSHIDFGVMCPHCRKASHYSDKCTSCKRFIKEQ